MAATEIPSPIGRYAYIKYDDPNDLFRPYDPRCPEVAALVAGIIQTGLPDVTVEHVGSTAIPGCDGKGVIDLLLLYPAGRIEAARDHLDAIGFQRHTGPNAFPEERPVRIGTIGYGGTAFRLHVHVVAEDSPEATEQRHFRDTLRSDAQLRDEYVARKRAIALSGIASGDQYVEAKDPFIRQVIQRQSSNDDSTR
jgi:GrpB-like predicted nucleotidyltransferase (UPF0157 family)